MEYQKFMNLLGSIPDQLSKFVTKKWVEIYDEAGGTYNANKKIRFKTQMIRSDLCDYNDAYIVATGKINVTNPNNNAYDKKLALKNNASFFSCITKINRTQTENAEDLDVVMPLYNLRYYSKNYRNATGSLWIYYRDEPNSGYNNNNRDRIHYLIKYSFNYKTGIFGELQNNEGELENIRVVVPLQHLSSFWRSLRIPLINCEISLDLGWSKNCVLISKATRNAIAAEGNNPAVATINNPANTEFNITDCKLYAPVVTLSAENENKLLEQLKTGFSLTVKWNKYGCQISNETVNNNLNYLIDPTFDKVDRLFVLAFENEEYRSSFNKYYSCTVEIKYYNVLIDQKPFFEIPIKNKEETYEAITELIRNSDYTTGNLLDYEYFSTHYKLIAIDLSKQTELENLDLKQQINFIGKLEQNGTIFFIIEKEEETILNVSQNSVDVS